MRPVREGRRSELAAGVRRGWKGSPGSSSSVGGANVSGTIRGDLGDETSWSESVTEHDARGLPQQWHSWGSPIGLGVGLLCVGGFFVLLALGLSILASIG